MQQNAVRRSLKVEMSNYRKPAPRPRDPNEAIRAKLEAFAREDAKQEARERFRRYVRRGLVVAILLGVVLALIWGGQDTHPLAGDAGLVLSLVIIAGLGFTWTRLAESIDVTGGGGGGGGGDATPGGHTSVGLGGHDGF